MALVLPWFVAAIGFRLPFRDNSYLWHVVAGRIQIAAGRVLTEDPFSFTMGGSPWRTQSWLAELVYAPLDALMGLGSADLITASMAAITFGLLGLAAYGRSQSVLSVSVYLAATAIVLAPFLNPRPVIFSFPLFAALVATDDDERLAWAAPLVMWIWASVHGSFVLGLLFLFLRAVGRGLSIRSAPRLGAVGVSTLATAHGWGVVDTLLAFARNREAVDLMQEWATPDLLSPPFLPLFAAILALVWLAQRGQLFKRDWWLLAPFLAIGLSANRAVPPAWIALTPILGRLTIPLRSATRLRAPVAVGLIALLAVAPLAIPRHDSIDLQRFPVEASAHLSRDHVFHGDGTGGWLIYRQWPQRQVYIDDRAELYGSQMVTFTEVRNGKPGWREELERWSIDEALLRRGEPLAETLRVSGWDTAYEDPNFVVLRR